MGRLTPWILLILGFVFLDELLALLSLIKTAVQVAQWLM